MLILGTNKLEKCIVLGVQPLFVFAVVDNSWFKKHNNGNFDTKILVLYLLKLFVLVTTSGEGKSKNQSCPWGCANCRETCVWLYCETRHNLPPIQHLQVSPVHQVHESYIQYCLHFKLTAFCRTIFITKITKLQLLQIKHSFVAQTPSNWVHFARILQRVVVW